MHNGLNSQPTVWTEECRCPSPRDFSVVAVNFVDVGLYLTDEHSESSCYAASR
jgi:predicted nucleic acid-binding Zn ribbon protein